MKEITPMEVAEMLKENDPIHLIDVREVEEVKEGKIPGAINIPLRLLEAKMPDLDKNIEYTMVCLSGGRSGRAAQFLESYGFKIVNMSGGMMSWNGPVE